jgi:hypothetical protein
MPMKSFILFNIIYIVFALNISADEAIEDDLGGFSEEITVQEELPVQKEQSSTKLTGDLAFKTSTGYKKHSVDGIEYSGFNQAQTSLFLQLDSKLSDDWKMRISANMFYDGIYDMYSHNDYRSEVEDEYKTELRLDDTYLQGKLTSSLDLKVGRQIVVWGKSDSIRITDVINPLDNRLPGMTDIEDLRLSVGMAKLDYYFDMWNISAILIAENRIMLEAPPRSEFFPVDGIFAVAPDPFLDLKTPSTSFSDMQYALAVNGTFSGWDLSFYASHVLDQKWHFDHVQGSAPMTDITRIVNKIDMLGTAINVVSGNWLLKSEIAYISGIGYNSTADEKNRLDALVGFDYTGFRDTVISVEVANRHIFDYEAQMKNQADYVDKDEMQTAIRLTRSFSNETINATALLSMFGSSWEDGGFARVWVDYEIMDALSVNLGVVDYIGGDKVFRDSIKDNDRIFADITYSF